jgi:SAM-dependent methyltransferase
MGSDAEFDRYARDYDKLRKDSTLDSFAKNADFYHHRKWILIRDFFRKHTTDTSKLRWLDVGCGKGELLNYGASSFQQVVGCDPSEGMVQDASGIEVHWQKEPTVLPFPNASFDFVTAVCVYHHVEEPNRIPLTKEIQRVLRPDGIFCMIEHNPFNPVTQRIVRTCPIDVDAHLLTPAAVRRCASTSGLRHMETQYFLYLPQKLYEKMAALELALMKIPLGGQYATFTRK